MKLVTNEITVKTNGPRSSKIIFKSKGKSLKKTVEWQLC